MIGLPSARYGEEVMAWVGLRPGASLDEAALTACCTGKIATYKAPRSSQIVDELPMTVTGNFQEYRMREISVAELGLGAGLTMD